MRHDIESQGPARKAAVPAKLNSGWPAYQAMVERLSAEICCNLETIGDFIEAIEDEPFSPSYLESRDKVLVYLVRRARQDAEHLDGLHRDHLSDGHPYAEFFDRGLIGGGGRPTSQAPRKSKPPTRSSTAKRRRQRR